MRVMWFFSGMTARLLGLWGLAASGILATNAYQLGLIDPVSTGLLAALALFCFVKAGQFLLPRVHRNALLRAAGGFRRVLFVLTGLAWLLVSGFVILEFARQANVAPNSLLARGLLGGAVLSLILFAFFFVFGAGFRAYAAHRVAQSAHPDAEHVEYHAGKMSAMVADAPPPRMLAKRYESVTNNPSSRLRQRDVWDYFGLLMVLAAGIGGLYAYRFGTTVQTAEFDLLIEQNLLFVFAGVTIAFAAPVFLMTAFRAPTTPAHERMGAARRFISNAVIGTPLVGALLTIVVAFDLAPYAWNLATTNDEGTIRYRVVELERTARIRDCVRFSIVGEVGRDVLNCGLDSDLVGTIRPGMIIEATGELSPYGHSMDQVTIIQ